MTMKSCAKCHTEKSLDSFNKAKVGLQAYCRACTSENSKKYYKEHQEQLQVRQRLYKKENPDEIRKQGWKRQEITNCNGTAFTVMDFDRLYQIQCGKCAICGINQSTITIRLNVDHDHKTGHVRGLLCSNCNKNVGILENTEFRRTADAYLNKHP